MSVVVQLKSLDAKVFAKEAKDMLGVAFGKVIVSNFSITLGERLLS